MPGWYARDGPGEYGLQVEAEVEAEAEAQVRPHRTQHVDNLRRWWMVGGGWSVVDTVVVGCVLG